MNNKEILQKINLNYCEIKLIIEDSEWTNLVLKSELGEQIQSDIEDALHYLSELMGHIQESFDE